MPFLLAEILNFQCALHLKGVGSLSYLIIRLAYLGLFSVTHASIPEVSKSSMEAFCLSILYQYMEAFCLSIF